MFADVVLWRATLKKLKALHPRRAGPELSLCRLACTRRADYFALLYILGALLLC